MPFSPDQHAKVKAILEKEPCLYNARHKKSYATMMAWMNEVAGKQITTEEEVAQIMQSDKPTKWDAVQGKHVEVEGPEPVSEDGTQDPWEAQRAEISDALK